jgi:Zn-dependent protease/predicted transcriptional regulator
VTKKPFSLMGVRIRIDRSWFVALVLFAWTLSAGYFPFQAPNYSRAVYWTFGTLSALALFGSVLIHELSHCVVARRLGVPVRQITLFIFGGVSEMAQTHSSSPAVEFRIAIAGPLSSFGLGVFFGLTTFLTRSVAPGIVVEAFHYLYYVNFLLAVFNLIPGFPLDGGRVLRSYLWYRSGDPRRATRSAAQVGAGIAVGLMVLGLVSVLMMSIVPGIWMMLIGLFLKKSAENEYRAVALRLGLKDMTLRQIMSPPVAVEPSMTIGEFISDYVFHYHYRVFPVVEGDDFKGMIDVRSIKGVPTNEWQTAWISRYLADPSTYVVLSPDMDAADTLRLLLERNCGKAPIVENGVLVGIITQEDLFKLISLKSDLAA